MRQVDSLKGLKIRWIGQATKCTAPFSEREMHIIPIALKHHDWVGAHCRRMLWGHIIGVRFWRYGGTEAQKLKTMLELNESL